MAEPIKSALFVDYDSLHRSLGRVDGKAAARLAERSAAWVAAIEAGDLASPPGKLRRVLLRRCYADPAVLADDGEVLVDAGFDIVECPPSSGGAIPMQLAIDVAATAAGAAHDEFVLLTSDADLTTLLAHLKARNLSSAIYATDGGADRDRKLVDAVVEERALVALLASDEAPVVARPSAPAVDRGEVEAFARKLHAATKVPLFSPKAFGELFRHLTEEIAANGYHFQSTAENVAVRMAESGRSATRRQVVFVVKGLALKGHVFSTSDTPERLAEVFREQVLYLAHNAGLELDDKEERLLTAWICGRTATVDGTPAKKSKGDKPDKADAKDRSEAAAAEISGDKHETQAEPPEKEPTKAKEDKPSDQPEVGKSQSSRAAAARSAMADRKAAIAARIAAAAKPLLRSGTKQSASAAKPASPAKSATKTAPPPPTDDQIESSILAAIAEAVDVLVEDSGDDRPGKAKKPSRPAPQPTKASKPSPTVEERPDPIPSDGGDSDDIGDEIQRIIASYNRNRKKGEDG